jgi:cytochrome c-type biogenesis protein CcmH/NrfF
VIRRAGAVALVAALLFAPAAGAQEPRASLPDIEDEVMCTICGTLLELSENAQADRQRVFIRSLIAQGLTKDQIKDALVVEYGESVLATPDDSGFDLTAWLLPIIAAAVGAAGVGYAVYRWRRERPGEPADPPPAGPQGADAERLDADLARYDL